MIVFRMLLQGSDLTFDNLSATADVKYQVNCQNKL